MNRNSRFDIISDNIVWVAIMAASPVMVNNNSNNAIGFVNNGPYLSDGHC